MAQTGSRKTWCQTTSSNWTFTTGTRVLRAVDDEELRALILRRLSQKWVKKALAVVEASIPAICGVPCEAGRSPTGPRQLSHHDGAYDRSAGHQADRGCLYPTAHAVCWRGQSRHEVLPGKLYSAVRDAHLRLTVVVEWAVVPSHWAKFTLNNTFYLPALFLSTSPPFSNGFVTHTLRARDLTGLGFIPYNKKRGVLWRA